MFCPRTAKTLIPLLTFINFFGLSDWKNFSVAKTPLLTFLSCLLKVLRPLWRPPLTTQSLRPHPGVGNSYIIPPNNHNASLDTCCQLVERDVSLLLGNKRQYKLADNLTREACTKGTSEGQLHRDPERWQGRSHRHDGQLLLWKGGSQTTHNTTFYRKHSANPTADFKRQIQAQLDHFLEIGEINKSEYSFMTVEFPIIPGFFTLSQKYTKRI